VRLQPDRAFVDDVADSQLGYDVWLDQYDPALAAGVTVDGHAVAKKRGSRFSAW
jgi:hypothetical protein